MPTESDGGNASPPDPANSSPPTSNRGRGRRARQRSNKKSKGKTGRPSKSTPPPGAKSELGNNYYEIPGVDPNLPSFTEVTRSIITHFVSENDNAVDYMCWKSSSAAMDTVHLPHRYPTNGFPKPPLTISRTMTTCHGTAKQDF